jgi:predicted nuclease of restriction endonuclease-like (RecB) superfamily
MNKSNERNRRNLKSRKDVIMPVPVAENQMPDSYSVFFRDLKKRIQQGRLKIVLSANSALVMMYWDIGNSILQKQNNEGWGAKVIERTVAQIPWRSNLALLDKLKNSKQRLWYAQKTIENGWSRNILVFQIETRLHERIGQSTNNFDIALPPVDSDMANQVFKDPYVFDFLGTADTRREVELEQKLIDHLEKFLLELGQGFAFVGRQVHMEVGGSDFYIDLLFYHLKLRCYVVVELKSGKFQAGHVSQLNMYMNIVDDLMRHPDDKKTIGLLLVKEKNQTLAKYALDGYTNPIGVAEWEKQITDSLPEDLRSSLPTIEEIEREMEKGESKKAEG